MTDRAPTKPVSEETVRWLWMMSWCQNQRLPPADAEVWRLAGEAYEKRGSLKEALAAARNSPVPIEVDPRP